MTRAAADMTCLSILQAGIIAALLWDRGVIGPAVGMPRPGRRSTATETQGRARG